MTSHPDGSGPASASLAPPGAEPADAWFRHLVERAQDIITVVGGDGRIVYDSPAVARVLGYAQGELVGRNAFEMIHPGDLPIAVGLLLDTVSAPGRVALLTFRFRHRDGSWRYLESIGTALEHGSQPAVVVSSREVPSMPHAPAAQPGGERPSDWEQAEVEVLERLALAAELRDDDTGKHTRRVGELAGRLASALGLPEREAETIRRAAPLHDLGKIGIPDAILRKQGQLSEAELRIMRTHAQLGAALLAGGRSALIRAAEEIALSHHERWDGTGYPNGIRRDRIPLTARIVAVVDCFDALSHDRPYRTALPAPLAVEQIRRGIGTHFDPAVAHAFLDLLA
jgi:PAS domain S-box-containing protein